MVNLMALVIFLLQKLIIICGLLSTPKFHYLFAKTFIPKQERMTSYFLYSNWRHWCVARATDFPYNIIAKFLLRDSATKCR